MKKTENGVDNSSLFDISDLIKEYLGGELSQDQQSRLDDWLQEDEAHMSLFDSICSKATIQSKFQDYKESDSSTAYYKFRLRRRANKVRRLVQVATAAAAVLALLFMGWQFQQDPIKDIQMAQQVQTPNEENTKITHPNKPLLKMYTGEEFVIDSSGYVAKEISTQFGEKNKSDIEPETLYNEMVVPSKCDFYFTMNDGTKVWMNANSTVRYPVSFAKNERTIYVSGEVYLDVAKDEGRPFNVELEGMRVAVLGTSFNVRAYADEKKRTVTLVEGKVKATIQSKDYDLRPGKQLTLDSDINGVSIADVDVNDITAWTRGFYVFKKSSLSEVASTLQNWYDIDIVFNTQKSRDIEYTGVINKNEPIEVFTNRLREVSNVRFVQKENKLYIY